MPEVYILTGPVGIGKSTLLKQFTQSSSLCGGFITEAKENNQRIAHLLPQKQPVNFSISTDTPIEDIVRVGKFSFSKEAFVTTWNHIQNQSSTFEWYIFDEVGKLEINQNEGFEPELTDFIANLNQRWVFVVRSSLLEAFKEKYPLRNVKINMGPWMQEVPKITGLLLAGGTSERMKRDKRFIEYHQMPQWQYAISQLEQVVNHVVISTQTPLQSQYPEYADLPEFMGSGPMSGLLSVFEGNLDNALLVLGIDYPQVSITALQDLYFTYQIRNTTVVYINPESGFIEPLVALYHPKHLEEIKIAYKKGETSLYKWLNAHQSELVVLTSTNANELRSFDYPEDEASFRTT